MRSGSPWSFRLVSPGVDPTSLVEVKEVMSKLVFRGEPLWAWLLLGFFGALYTYLVFDWIRDDGIVSTLASLAPLTVAVTVAVMAYRVQPPRRIFLAGLFGGPPAVAFSSFAGLGDRGFDFLLNTTFFSAVLVGMSWWVARAIGKGWDPAVTARKRREAARKRKPEPEGSRPPWELDS